MRLVKVRRSVTVEYFISQGDYGDMTLSEIVEYEQSLEGGDRQEALFDYLGCGNVETWSVDAEIVDKQMQKVVCEHCSAVNEITPGTDPGEYRCIGCVQWL